MNTNFKVIGLTRPRIKAESTAQEAGALSTQLSELINFTKALEHFDEEQPLSSAWVTKSSM